MCCGPDNEWPNTLAKLWWPIPTHNSKVKQGHFVRLSAFIFAWRKLKQLDDEWPESIFHHVGSQSASYPVSVRCEVLRRFPASS